MIAWCKDILERRKLTRVKSNNEGGNVTSLMTASALPRHDRYARSSLTADLQLS
uniref:Uncharacterized protein n=1 Tax=Proteus vulgaris TaxID=585 RepID=Q8KK94_PROVU|nr:hypothetical protein [Proteus vulgaris]